MIIQILIYVSLQFKGELYLLTGMVVHNWKNAWSSIDIMDNHLTKTNKEFNHLWGGLTTRKQLISF